LAFIFMAAAWPAVRPPVGVTVCLSMSIMLPLE
jgi:hypothetical protein